MKRLILIRHAKSSWDEPEQADYDRPLAKRGKNDAPQMGKRLKILGTKTDLIISSPAKRAIDTIRIVAEEIGYPKKRIKENREFYEAGMNDLLDVLHRVDNVHNDVMLCGHNPGLTDLSNFLADCRIDNIPTCGIVCMDFAVDSWSDLTRGSGRLVFFDYPKKPPK